MVKDKLGVPSNKTFGLFWSLIFILASLFSFVHHSVSLSIFLLILSVTIAILALKRSFLLSRLNRLWAKVGYLLGMIVSPIILGVLFFILISPISIFFKLVGRDALKVKFRPDSVESYWIDTEIDRPQSESFKEQF